MVFPQATHTSGIFQRNNQPSPLMTIHQASEKHLGAILQIMNEAILHTTAVYDYNPRSEEYVKQWFETKKINQMPVLIAESEGQLMGYATFGEFRTRDAYMFSIEHSIYVDQKFQKQGVGKALMTALIHQARSEGYHTMIAGIDAANQFSIQFHAGAGFTEVGRLKEVGYKFNQWLDLVFMQLMLNDENRSL